MRQLWVLVVFSIIFTYCKWWKDQIDLLKTELKFWVLSSGDWSITFKAILKFPICLFFHWSSVTKVHSKCWKKIRVFFCPRKFADNTVFPRSWPARQCQPAFRSSGGYILAWLYFWQTSLRSSSKQNQTCPKVFVLFPDKWDS